MLREIFESVAMFIMFVVIVLFFGLINHITGGLFHHLTCEGVECLIR